MVIAQRSTRRPTVEPPERTSGTIGGKRGQEVLRSWGLEPLAVKGRVPRVRCGDLQGVGCCGREDSPLGPPRRTLTQPMAQGRSSHGCRTPSPGGPPGRTSPKRGSSAQGPGPWASLLPLPQRSLGEFAERFNPQALKGRPEETPGRLTLPQCGRMRSMPLLASISTWAPSGSVAL